MYPTMISLVSLRAFHQHASNKILCEEFAVNNIAQTVKLYFARKRCERGILCEKTCQLKQYSYTSVHVAGRRRNLVLTCTVPLNNQAVVGVPRNILYPSVNVLRVRRRKS